MKRKVNRVGQNTLTVSLPASWVKRSSIESGDEVNVIEQGTSLVVMLEDKIKPTKAVLDTSKFGFFHKSMLSDVYHLGYDEVEVHFKDEKEFKQIQDRLQSYIGFEVVDQGEKHCLIKDVSKSSELEFDSVLRRIFLLLVDISDKCVDAISNKEFERLKEIRLLEALNNRFTDYCLRVLNKRGYKDEKRRCIIYSLVHDLERIGDEYKRICDYFYEEKKAISPELLKAFQKISKYLRAYYELYYKYDQDRFRYVLEEGKSIVNNMYSYLGSKNKAEARLAHHLIYITIAIYDLSYTYVEMNV